MRDYLEEYKNESNSIISICGLAGIGKTLFLKYFLWEKSFHRKTEIFWIQPEDIRSEDNIKYFPPNKSFLHNDLMRHFMQFYKLYPKKSFSIIIDGYEENEDLLKNF